MNPVPPPSTDVPPFDAVALRYDDDFTRTPLGRRLRAAVWRYLLPTFAPGSRILDLGCGTGEDAVALARRGVQVSAVDAAPAMVALARRRAAAAGVAARVEAAQADLSTGMLPDGPFDGAYADFGALNGVTDRRRLAASLAGRLRPGAPLMLVVMGPYCPWEWAWYLLSGRPRIAFRRLGGLSTARVGDRTMEVAYPAPARLDEEFAPYFVRRQTAGIGVLLPPTFAGRVVNTRPRLLARLAAMEARAAESALGARLNDHYLARYERTTEDV